MRSLLFLILLCCLTSCGDEPKPSSTIIDTPDPEQIVVISINAPGRYAHVIKQDSVGKKIKDSIGPKLFVAHYGFSYLDNQNAIQTWTPKKGQKDTLVIPYYKGYLELASNNPYTSILETFLIKNGDTVIFNYKNNLPVAQVANRKVNDTALNYNRFRLKHLFNNKYTSHQLIMLGIFFRGVDDFDTNTLNHYLQARTDYEYEKQLLDSLGNAGILSETELQYRKNTLDVLMENHKKNKTVARWLNGKTADAGEGEFSTAAAFDLAGTDSLMTYSFFRNHLNNISQYDLSFITENNGSSGGSYIDSRIRFDSILQDKRFNQRAKDFLLFDAYEGIGRNFRVKDKQEYLEKLQNATTDPARLKKLITDFNLDFQYSDQLIVTTRKNDTLTYQEVLDQNRGKWLYVDFWASWCAPCRKTMPASARLNKDLKDENIEFLYVSLRDDKEKWKAAIISDSLHNGQHFFAENSNTSKVMEELGVKTIPHYIIYNPQGEVEYGFAKRPGKGAKEQLETLLKLE